MKSVYKFAAFLVAAAIAVIGIGCNASMNEANKLVDEANVAIKKANENSTKGADIIKAVFGKLSDVEDFDAFKTENKTKIDELTKLLESSSKDYGDAGSKFEAASKLDVSAKFKEYLGLKGQEIKKRSEHEKATLDFVKAFQGESEAEKIDTLVGDFNKKSADIIKEADDLSKKAEQIVKDNPNDFKAN